MSPGRRARITKYWDGRSHLIPITTTETRALRAEGQRGDRLEIFLMYWNRNANVTETNETSYSQKAHLQNILNICTLKEDGQEETAAVIGIC